MALLEEAACVRRHVYSLSQSALHPPFFPLHGPIEPQAHNGVKHNAEDARQAVLLTFEAVELIFSRMAI